MLLLAISGSLRRDSLNRRLLRAAAAHLPRGARFELLEGLEALPAYDEALDIEPAPEPVRWLRGAIDAADAVVIASPEYNASIPGALKNALDWASRPFPDNCLRGKPVAVVGASTGLFGAVWAHADLRRVLRVIGADVVDAELSVPRADTAFADGGDLRDPALAHALRTVVARMVERVDDRAA
jgi:chromate reductase, NAD(P)H dehydrogenase (quinone)